MVHFDKKIIEGKSIYVQFALSVQKGHIKYPVAPKGAYRPQNFVLNFGLDMCVDVKKYFRKKLRDF